MIDPAFGLLGLAARARSIATGDVAMKQVRSKQAFLVIMSKDVGNNTKKKICDKCLFYQIPLVYMDETAMNTAIGTNNRKFIAITDEGFATKLHTCLKG